MLGYVTLPTNFVSLVSAQAGTIFTDLAPVAMFIGGVLLGLFIVNFIIGSLGKQTQPEGQTNEVINEVDDDYLNDNF
jgi:hypothetical protein